MVMHHVSRVAVEGFWDTHDLELRLFPEVTFLIGPNGTGKTTLINLIAAALTADFRTLDRIPFRRITVFLSQMQLEQEPRISVIKSKKKERPFELIEYRLRGGSKNAAEIRYSLDDIEEQFLMRRVAGDARFIRDAYRYMPSELATKLQELVHVNWLSVHRALPSERPREDRSFESAVDQRLENNANELVRYFSILSRQKDDEIRSFQEFVFVSLIEEQSGDTLFETSDLRNMDLFVNTLKNIFNELHVTQDSANALLDTFADRGKSLRNKLRKSNSPNAFPINDAVYLLGLKRVSAVVTRWNSLQTRLDQIFSPRDRWLRIANELFQRKEMELTASNELQFMSRSGKTLKMSMLSSGEKQLLILLNETLLQREMPSVFIADEPELSLHVLWQERLVASLRALNPAAQIIAATHSPDIVGRLADFAVDMESLIP